MRLYQDKRVLITGGTSGIGLETGRYLQREGAKLLITGRSAKALDEARQQLDTTVVIESDTAKLNDIHLLRSHVERALGGLDLLFINAGINTGSPFEAATEHDYDEALAVNTKGPYFTIQTLAPLIADGGAIVVTTSVANVKGLPGTSIYGSTKAALRSMVRTFARELSVRNVRVNAVSPGPIDTPILVKTLGEAGAEKARAQYRDTNPMKRFGTSDEVARAVAYLAFDATYTTGAELTIDGGASQL